MFGSQRSVSPAATGRKVVVRREGDGAVVEIPLLGTVKLREGRLPWNVQVWLDGPVEDLNDLDPAQEGQPWLECTEATAIDNEKLRRFCEVLKNWDFDRDGRPDCDAVLTVIEALLTQSTEEPTPFARPAGGPYVRMLMALMPPQPDRHIVYGFGQLKRRFRWYHYPLAVVTMAFVLGMILIQTHFVPWTKYSVVSGAMAIAEGLAPNGVMKWAVFGALLVLYDSSV